MDTIGLRPHTPLAQRHKGKYNLLVFRRDYGNIGIGIGIILENKGTSSLHNPYITYSHTPYKHPLRYPDSRVVFRIQRMSLSFALVSKHNMLLGVPDKLSCAIP